MKKVILLAISCLIILFASRAQVSNMNLNGKWMRAYTFTAIWEQNNVAYCGGDSIMYLIDISSPSMDVNSERALSQVILDGTINWIKTVNGNAYVAEDMAGLSIVDVNNTYAPMEIGHISTNGAAKCVALQGSYAYVAADTAGLRIIDVSNPASPVTVGVFDLGNTNANAVVVSGNYAYIAYGTSGLRIVDISNPSNPVAAGSFSTNAFDPVNIAISGTKVFALDDSLQSFDVSSANAPVHLSSWIYYVPFYYNTLAVSGNYAYVIDNASSVCVDIVDISNPSAMTLAGSYYCYNTNFGLAQGACIDGNRMFLCEVDYSNESYLSTIDIANPASPILIGGHVQPEFALDVCSNGNFAFVLEWTAPIDGYITCFDISNPQFISQRGRMRDTISAGMLSEMVNVGNILYVTGVRRASTSDLGMRILDYTNVLNPFQLGQFNVSGATCKGISVSGNYAYLCFMANGFRIVDVSNPSTPVQTASLSLNGGFQANEVSVCGNYAYVTDNSSNLHVIDVSNPAAPVDMTMLSLPAVGSDIYAEGNYVYVACGAQGLRIVDVSNPLIPSIVGSYTSVSNDSRLHLHKSGNAIYLSDFMNGIQKIDVTSASSPFQVGYYYDLDGYTRNVFADAYSVFAVTDAGLYLLHDATITGVSLKQGEDQFSIYPNPSSGDFFVSTPNASEYHLELINADGQLVRSAIQHSDQLGIDVRDLPRGIYFLRISDEDGNQIGTRKIILQ